MYVTYFYINTGGHRFGDISVTAVPNIANILPWYRCHESVWMIPGTVED